MKRGCPSLNEAKLKLNVATLWKVIDLPGEPGRSCRCPLHDDRSASFSIFTGRKGDLRWKCHAGCGSGGSVELLEKVFDITQSDACRRLREMAFGNNVAFPQVVLPKPASAPQFERHLRSPENLRRCSQDDLQAVARRRQLSGIGVELASTRGLLWFATLRDHPAWIVTDTSRVNAQARRMDGEPWEHIGGKKAWTLPGSRARWPIGAPEAAAFPFVVLVEGGPDLIAAHQFIVDEGRQADVAAVAMLGASNDIPPEAAEHFASKRVRIFPHTDSAGQTAAGRWRAQLETVGATVDAFSFAGLLRADGMAVKDLNDFACLSPECWEAEKDELAEVLPR